MPEPFLIRCFISGLHEDIRAGVKLLSPHTLLQAYTIAKQQEETTSALVPAVSKRQSSRSPFNRSSYPPTPPPPLPNPPSKWTTPNPSTSANIPSGVRRLSIVEQQERRAKNLCFNCDEQYRPGYHSKRPQLLLLEADDSAAPIERSDEDNEEEPPVELSLHALCGTTRLETMCLLGHIKRHSLLVLVDSGATHNFLHPGATHNFLHPKIAKRCGLQVTKSEPISVTVANGYKEKSPGR